MLLANAEGERGQQAVTGLIQALKDKKEGADVRQAAVEALGLLANAEGEHWQQAFTGVIQVLKDEQSWVRAAAAEALNLTTVVTYIENWHR